jgi:predicted porin
VKKSLLALATLSAFAGTAYADDGLFTLKNDDTTLSLYGVLDAAYGTQNHSYGLNNQLPNQSYAYVGKIYATAPSQTAMINGGLSDSRWGIKGSKVITGDMKAIFDLESGFDITNMKLNNAARTLANNSGAHSATNLPPTLNADSSLNGGMFDRAAWAGVQASWGTLTYGTQNNPVKDAVGDYDPVASDTFSPLGESGTWGGGVGSSEQSRMHHSLKYSNKLGGGFDMSLAYQFGNDLATNYGKTYAARVGYENGPFGLTAAYSNSKDAVVAGTSGTLGQINVSVYDVAGYFVGGKYKINDDAKIKVGYEHFTRKSPTDTIKNYGAIWGIGIANQVAAGFPAGVSQAFNMYFVGGDYNFMPDLNLAVGYYNSKADPRSDVPTTGGISNSDYKVDTWSAVLKYNVTKRLDVYAAATANKFSGGTYDSVAATANAYATNVTAYGIGARYKF